MRVPRTGSVWIELDFILASDGTIVGGLGEIVNSLPNDIIILGNCIINNSEYLRKTMREKRLALYNAKDRYI